MVLELGFLESAQQTVIEKLQATLRTAHPHPKLFLHQYGRAETSGGRCPFDLSCWFLMETGFVLRIIFTLQVGVQEIGWQRNVRDTLIPEPWFR